MHICARVITMLVRLGRGFPIDSNVFLPMMIGCPVVSSFTRFKSGDMRQISWFSLPSSRFLPIAAIILIRGADICAIYTTKNATSRATASVVHLLHMEAQATTDRVLEKRYYEDYNELTHVVDSLKKEGKKVVLTQGVYDLLHIGHAQYLAKARAHGDVLIVGVDSDALTRRRKGDGRPVVPEGERIAMLLHLRPVDIVVLRDVDKELEALIKTVRPDVYIASESTKDFSVGAELASYCGEVHVLPPQATTSTTARVRQVSMLGADELAKELAEQIPQIVHTALHKIKSK